MEQAIEIMVHFFVWNYEEITLLLFIDSFSLRIYRKIKKKSVQSIPFLLNLLLENKYTLELYMVKSLPVRTEPDHGVVRPLYVKIITGSVI